MGLVKGSQISSALITNCFVDKKSNSVLEWKLILNRAGKATDQEDIGRMIVCPRHRFHLTTYYKAKVRFAVLTRES